jgi:hypothetical protein
MRLMSLIRAALGMFFVASASEAQLKPFRDSTSKLWGYKRADGSVAILPRFVGAGDFRNGIAPVRDPLGYALIDPSGGELERFYRDRVGASPDSIPPPIASCRNLDCYIFQMARRAPYLGGEIVIDPSPRKGRSRSAFVQKIPNGVVVLKDSAFNGATVRVLLPGVTAAQAREWRRSIRSYRTSRLDGCYEYMESGPVRGGAYIESRRGC